MIWDELAKAGVQLVAGNPQDAARVQEQIKPLLERRLQPCIDLWQKLWPFANGETVDVPALRETVDDFLRLQGLIISVPLLAALGALKEGLLEIERSKDDTFRDLGLDRLRKQVYPRTEKDANGQSVVRPGLLLLLRDELGSNSRAAASTLK